jgi:hypothetical protein
MTQHGSCSIDIPAQRKTTKSTTQMATIIYYQTKLQYLRFKLQKTPHILQQVYVTDNEDGTFPDREATFYDNAAATTTVEPSPPYT